MTLNSFINPSFLGNPIDVGGDINLLNGLTFWYKLEELSGTRLDSSVNGLDLSQIGSVGQNDGIIDKCAQFNGGTAKLIRSFDPLYDLSDTDFSITGWMNLDIAVSGHAIYIGKGGTGSADRVINLIYLSGGNEMRFVLSNDTSTSNLLAGQISGSIPIAEWFFFCVSYNKTTKLMSLSLNNQDPVTLVSAGNPQNFGTQSLVLGNSVSDQNPLEGRVDELGMWNRVLTANECTFLFNGGSANRPPFGQFVTYLGENVTYLGEPVMYTP